MDNTTDGYPKASDVAFLRKAHYGTKQGGRQFYDKIAKDLLDIGLIQYPNEPCLFRFFLRPDPNSCFVCFLILYVDDGLIIGEEEALKVVMDALSKHYKCKWEEPKDYLGMDLNTKPGKISFSIETFMDGKIHELQLVDSDRGE